MHLGLKRQGQPFLTSVVKKYPVGVADEIDTGGDDLHWVEMGQGWFFLKSDVIQYNTVYRNS